MNLKLSTLYHLTETASQSKSAKLTWAEPRHSSRTCGPSSCSATAQMVTCSVLEPSLERGTDTGKCSPKLGFCVLEMEQVQKVQAEAGEPAWGSKEALMQLDEIEKFQLFLLTSGC